MAERRRDEAARLRLIIVVLASIAWGLQELLPLFTSRVPPSPEALTAYCAVLGAALALPEVERWHAGRQRRRRDQEDDEDG